MAEDIVDLVSSSSSQDEEDETDAEEALSGEDTDWSEEDDNDSDEAYNVFDDDEDGDSGEEVNDEDPPLEKVIELLKGGGNLEALKLTDCKAYLRKQGLRIGGTKALCIERITEHWRIKSGNGQEFYPISSFVIDCTGDICKGDVVLFTQKVHEKLDKMTRHEELRGKRIVAGRVVKESYGVAKQQHTFTVEVLWSKGAKELPPLYPLLIKGRNLYRLKAFRQRWQNEAERLQVLDEKHRRGVAARKAREARKAKKFQFANAGVGTRKKKEAEKENLPVIGDANAGAATRNTGKAEKGKLDKGYICPLQEHNTSRHHFQDDAIKTGRVSASSRWHQSQPQIARDMRVATPVNPYGSTEKFNRVALADPTSTTLGCSNTNCHASFGSMPASYYGTLHHNSHTQLSTPNSLNNYRGAHNNERPLQLTISQREVGYKHRKDRWHPSIHQYPREFDSMPVSHHRKFHPYSRIHQAAPNLSKNHHGARSQGNMGYEHREDHWHRSICQDPRDFDAKHVSHYERFHQYTHIQQAARNPSNNYVGNRDIEHVAQLTIGHREMAIIQKKDRWHPGKHQNPGDFGSMPASQSWRSRPNIYNKQAAPNPSNNHLRPPDIEHCAELTIGQRKMHYGKRDDCRHHGMHQNLRDFPTGYHPNSNGYNANADDVPGSHHLVFSQNCYAPQAALKQSSYYDDHRARNLERFSEFRISRRCEGRIAICLLR